MSSYQKIVDLRNMYLIKKSGYFDDKYYKLEYPEVRGNRLKHYYYEGWKKGYNPSEKFDNDYYLLHNTDVENAGINPLLHYIISGSNEGRRIMKVFGSRISTIYSLLNHHKYSYVSYLEGSSQKRITVFYNNEDDFDNLLEIIQQCNKNNTFVRVIYNKVDFNRFYQFVNEKHINKSYIELIKWNSRYYLSVGLNERFICFDYYILNSLLNTLYINTPVYYFVSKNNIKDSIQNMWLSYYVEKEKVILIGDKELVIPKYNLIVQNNIQKINKDTVKIGFKFDCLSIPMLKIYQEYFIYQDDLKNYEFTFNSSNFYKNISFDNNITITYQPNLDNVDILIEFSYDKDDLKHSKNDNSVQIYFEKSFDKLEIYKLNNLFDKEGEDNV